jgi:hypothetical protein
MFAEDRNFGDGQGNLTLHERLRPCPVNYGVWQLADLLPVRPRLATVKRTIESNTRSR